MICVMHDPDYDLIWMRYRREPFAPGSLAATAKGAAITVWMRGGSEAILSMDFSQICDANNATFSTPQDCVSYLNDIFNRRRAMSAQYTQATPATVWTISHGLTFQPKALVIDSAGDPVLTDTRYPAPGIVELQFSAPTSGIAYLS